MPSETQKALRHGAPPASELQRLAAEFIGTFLLTFVAAGGGTIAAVSNGKVSEAAAVVAPALVVMALIYTVGDLSGAHFNPAVTFGFALRRDFPWMRVPGYWTAQIAGAILAAVVLWVMFGDAGELGATLPRHGEFASLGMEIILTFTLALVIFGTAIDHRLVGHNAALAVCATIALDGLFAAPISGASMNPARSFGPDLIGGHLESYWIYLVGPMLGMIAAVGATYLLRGSKTKWEQKAALGADASARQHISDNRGAV